MSAVKTMPGRRAQVTPTDSESYAGFVRRAHSALMRQIPDPYARNQAVWDAWDNTRGNPLRDRAQEFFPAEQYRHVPYVCYFTEHATKSRDGTPLNYGFDELAQLVATNNERADTDCYSAIASHHTSDHLKGPKHEPHTVGFAGPYSLGMVGHTNPKWAVFADEHHRVDESDLFDRRRRRSVEVMRFRDGRPSYFDPIATLGADSPRLALPVARYEASDAEVERYSFINPEFAAASGGNSHLPSFGGQKQRYEQSPPNQSPNGSQPSGESSMSGMQQIDSQSIEAIVQAIRSTPEMQWVQEQMTKAVTANPGPDLSINGGQPDPTGHQVPGGGIPPQQHGAPTPAPAPSPMHGGMPGMGGQRPPNAHHYSQLEDDDVTNEQYQALREENATLVEQYSELREQYSELAEHNTKLVEQHAALKATVVQIERRAQDAERTQRLRDLYQQYPHFVVLEEEFEKCLYSQNSTMSAEQFDAHLVEVEKYAQRSSPVTQMLPGGEIARASSDTEEEKLSKRVVERYTALADRGQFKSYDEIEAEVRKEMGLTA